VECSHDQSINTIDYQQLDDDKYNPANIAKAELWQRVLDSGEYFE
jgi:hypothetical protein